MVPLSIQRSWVPAKDKLGFILYSPKDHDNHGKDRTKLLKLLQDYTVYKRNYAKNIKYNPRTENKIMLFQKLVFR